MHTTDGYRTTYLQDLTWKAPRAREQGREAVMSQRKGS